MIDRLCVWCRGAIAATARRDSRFCGKKCRQAAWRLRSYASPSDRREALPQIARVLRFAYADPPYPGKARMYKKHPDYKGEVDHVELIKRLTSTYDGWALSTSARALQQLLPLCPPEVRVCAWVKPGGAPPATYGLHNVWEAIIVRQGRRIRPGRRDALYFHPARGGGDLVGRKPLQFCAWLFDAMGMLPGDSLDDLFPGTGVVAAAWAEASSKATSDASSAAADDRSVI